VRFDRPVVLILAVVAVSAAVASGVTYALVRHDSPAHKTPLAPIAFTGVLRNLNGKPVNHAWLQLTAMPNGAGVKPGVPIRIPLLAGAYTDSAGRFTIRQSVSRYIRKLAAENSGWVNFRMEFRAGGRYIPWGAPRKLSRGSWLAEDNPNMSAADKHERLTLQPFYGVVRVSFTHATRAQEQAVGTALRRLPNVVRVSFLSKKRAVGLMKQPGAGILNAADQWLVTTVSLSAEATVGRAICAAQYSGVEPCGTPPGFGSVQWEPITS
jgi:hypothetical protein